VTITLYGEPLWDSPYVFSTWIALTAKGVPFATKLLNLYGTRDTREPAYMERSITAKVPTIEHNGFWLSESAAIAEYLEEVFPPPGHPRLFPSDARNRARARQIMGWLRSELMPLRQERPTTTMFYKKATAPLSPKAQASADELVRVASLLVPEGSDTLFGEWCLADSELAFMLHRLILNDHPLPDALLRFGRAQWERPSVVAYRNQDRPTELPPGA
jgi:glutathione S-transferase